MKDKGEKDWEGFRGIWWLLRQNTRWNAAE